MSCKNCRTFFSIDDKSFVQNCCVPRFARHETLILPRHVTVMHPDDEHVLRESVGEPTHTRSSKEYTQRNTTVIVETHKPKQTQPKLTHRRLLLQPFCSTWKVFAPKVSAVLQRLLRDRHKSLRSVPSASSHLVRSSVFAPHVYTTFQRDLRSALPLDSIMFTCVETRSPCLSGVFPEDSSHRQSGIVQVSDITGRPRNNFPSKIGLVASASPFVLEFFPENSAGYRLFFRRFSFRRLQAPLLVCPVWSLQHPATSNPAKAFFLILFVLLIFFPIKAKITM